MTELFILVRYEELAAFMACPYAKYITILGTGASRCGLVKRLGFSPKNNIDYALKTVGRYRPIPLNKLEVERPQLYTLLKNEGIVY